MNLRLLFGLLIAVTLVTTRLHAAADSVFIDTNLNSVLDAGEPSFSTIQSAITAATAGNTIVVTAGTYTESVNDTKGLTFRASGVAMIVGQVTLNALGSKIYGFDVTNPNGAFGILINGFGNTEASNNIVHHIGTGAVGGTTYGIFFQDKNLVDADNVKIQNNTISNIGTATNGTNGGIGIGDSTGNSNLTGVVISSNTISDITANTTPVTPGKGAYGIIINHAIHNNTSNMGSVLAAQVTGNTISNLTGRWAHGIGLEGDTPNAVVTGNIIHHLTSTSVPNNAVAVTFEDNVSAASVNLHTNSFDTTSISYGVTNVVPSVTVDATNNYWATSTPASTVGGAVNYSPWYMNVAMTTFASALATETVKTASTPSGIVSVVIPAGVVATGPSGWDGILAVPAVTNTFTLTADVGNTVEAVSAIEVGAGDMPLTFDHPVKLTFAGLAGKLAGWSQAGTFHPIPSVCDSATAPTLSLGTDCKIDVGGDLIVWTKHFSAFIIYNQVPTTATPANSRSGGGRALPIPLINITKVPSPLALPGGSGSVTYTYTVTNVGVTAISGLLVQDDKCTLVQFVSGDKNNNSMLESDEAWIYRCTQTVSQTTINNASVHGFANGQDVYDSATVTVVVGVGFPNTGSIPPLINIIKVPSRLTPLPFGGGDVMYTYTLTNPGIAPMRDVVISDDKCASVAGPMALGDNNSNKMLDPGETWFYTCRTNVLTTTTNVATARGVADSLVALDYAFATVLVSTPGLPNTGSLSPLTIKLKGNSQVTTLREMNVRAHAGLMQTILKSERNAALGIIVGGPVEKDGHIWWQVLYGSGLTGWTAESGLTQAPQ